MNCIVLIRILWFFLLSKQLLPYNRILISLSWLRDERNLSMFIKSSRFLGYHWKTVTVRKSATLFRRHCCKSTTGLRSSKLCRNVCSRKWLSSNINLESNFKSNLAEFYKNFRKIDSSFYRHQVCSTPLWNKKERLVLQ